MSDEKIQKVLASAGFDSRRAVERAIEAGQIFVNGKRATIGDRVRAGDKIQWESRNYTVPDQRSNDIKVLAYNKPEGEVCSRNDPEGRPTVFDRLPQLKTGRWVSVGRLDINTSGLLLFTNDGALANKLMHPSSNVDREYLVRVQGEVPDETLERLKEGVLLEDGLARFSDIGRGKESSGSNTWFYCTVMEGRNREVRRLWESQELRVSRLKRVRYGPLMLPSYIRQGQWLELETVDVTVLYKAAGMTPPRLKKPTPKEQVRKERQVKKLRSVGGRKPVAPTRKKRS